MPDTIIAIAKNIQDNNNLVFKTAYLKNAFDIKNDMEFHIEMEPFKQNPVKVKIYKNDNWIFKSFFVNKNN